MCDGLPQMVVMATQVEELMTGQQCEHMLLLHLCSFQTTIFVSRHRPYRQVLLSH
jgi:hypothetical protein